jgi:hypothetical protein
VSWRWGVEREERERERERKRGREREKYHPGFWIVSYGQTVMEGMIIHELRCGVWELRNISNVLGFSQNRV